MSKPRISPENPLPRHVIAISAATCVFLLAVHQINNPDIFFHITLGRLLLHGEWPPVLANIYFTPVTGRWIGELRQTFLGDIVFALVDRCGGLLLVQAFGIVLLAGGGAILYRSVRDAVPSRDSTNWHIQVGLCALFYVLATLQLQMVRNAAFSLVFFPAAIVLARRIFRENRFAWIPALVALFALWSCFHGSYLLGIVIIAAMAAGALIDGARAEGIRRQGRRLVVCALAIATVTGVVSISNPAFKTYFRMPVRNLSAALGLDKPVRKVATPTPVVPKKKQPSGKPKRVSRKTPPPPQPALPPKSAPGILAWLASPLWPAQSDLMPASGDFQPSWKCLRYFPAMLALAGGFVVLGMLVFSRTPERWTLLLPLAATTYFGICYVRGTGYVAIMALWCLMRWKISSTPNSSKISPEPSHQWPVAACLALTAMMFLLATAQGRLGLVLGDAARTFGLGAASSLDEKTSRRVAEDDSLGKVFTTIWSGSFAEYCWQGKKPVFTDAFFPAHTDLVWKAYREAQTSRSLAPLAGDLAVDSALIENNRLDWQMLFWDDAGWAPVFLGPGMTCYARVLPGAPLPACEVLFDSQELEKIPNALARHDAAALLLNFQRMNVIRSMHGMSQQPLKMRDATLPQIALECLDPKVRAWMSRDGNGPKLIPLL